MKQFIIFSAFIFAAVCVVSGCTKPVDSNLGVPGSGAGPKTSHSSKSGGKKLSPEDTLFNRVIAYQVERLLEDADRKNGNKLSEYDAQIEEAKKEFSAAYERFDAEIAKASQLSGDPVADFAPARQAQSDYQAAEKKLKEFDELNGKQRDEFRAVRQAWFESRDLVSQANDEFMDAVKASLNTRSGVVVVSAEERARQYERKFVQDTKDANADNKELQAAAAEYEKILLLVESKTAELKAVAKPAMDHSNLWRRQSAYRSKARDLLAKPLDASAQKAYEELRKEGQELAALEGSLDMPAAERHGPLMKELADLEASYYNAFKKVALLVPMEDK